MKAHGKGLGFSIHGGTSHINAWKMELSGPALASKFEFTPLTSWPAREHPQQTRIDEFHALESLVK